MRLYIIRHADPDYPNHTITAAGHLEARALAERMAAEKLDRIVCSPLGRAQRTAAYTAERVGLPIDTRDWLTELPLRCTGRPWPDAMAWDVDGRILREGCAALQNGRYDPERHFRAAFNPEAEALLARVAASSDAFLAELGYKREGHGYLCRRPNTERVAVFCHGGLGLTWLAHLLGIPTELMWAGFWLATTSVTTVLMDQREDARATPRCLGLGDVSHLHVAGLPVQPAGIKANFY